MGAPDNDPAVDPAAYPTVEHVLVPYDGSELANMALRFAAATFPSAAIEAFHVVVPFANHTAGGTPGLQDDWHEIADRQATAVTDDAAEVAAALDRPIETNWEYGRPAQTIVQYIDEQPIDHVVMGSHGRSGLERVLLGSVAETVLRRSSVPVTVIRQKEAATES